MHLCVDLKTRSCALCTYAGSGILNVGADGSLSLSFQSFLTALKTGKMLREREVVLSVHKLAGAGAHIQSKDVQFQKACSFYLI